MNITIVGSGYVGFTIANLFAPKHKIIILDVEKVKISQINSGISPLNEKLILNNFSKYKNNIKGTLSENEAYKKCDLVIIAVPTNFDNKSGSFDTKIIDKVIKRAVKQLNNQLVVIKSTIPIGYTDRITKICNYKNIIFSPEFLREGKSLYDNLYPSRIIVGGKSNESKMFADLLESSSLGKTQKYFMESTEAESVKLFSNTYLAMRVAFFNELDSFAMSKGLNAQNIIEGICEDSRIGKVYNNPSFGYGGYCLPKDTRQLLHSFNGVPQSLIKATITSNEKRIKVIAKNIKKTKHKVIGFYRLTMKSDSDNLRSSSSVEVLKEFIKTKNNKKIIIYEPLLKQKKFLGCPVIDKLDKFINDAELIVSNRNQSLPEKKKISIFSRDIYNIDD